MEFGVFYQLPCGEGQTVSARYDHTIAQARLADELGFDNVWLAELHFNSRFSVMPAPLMVGSAIAATTQRIKIGMAVNLVWPSAEIAVMGAEGAVNIIYREEIAKAKNPDKKRQELVADYQEKFANPYVAASYGYVDDVIDPADTRLRIAKALEMLQNKRDTLPAKKHGNIPL